MGSKVYIFLVKSKKYAIISHDFQCVIELTNFEFQLYSLFASQILQK